MIPQELGLCLQLVRVQVVNVERLSTLGKDLLLAVTLGAAALLAF